MNGSAELAQLAHLLRVSAETARDIAYMRRVDARSILEISRQIDDVALRVEGLVTVES